MGLCVSECGAVGWQLGKSGFQSPVAVCGFWANSSSITFVIAVRNSPWGSSSYEGTRHEEADTPEGQSSCRLTAPRQSPPQPRPGHFSELLRPLSYLRWGKIQQQHQALCGAGERLIEAVIEAELETPALLPAPRLHQEGNCGLTKKDRVCSSL